MTLPNTNYSVSLSNYSKKTPVWLKIVCDILLGLAAIGEVSLPDFPGKQWVVFGCIAFKFIGKTITDDLTAVNTQPENKPEIVA